MLLYRGLRGSRLHGFATPQSDWDWLEVHDKIKTRSNNRGGEDLIRCNLTDFVKWAEGGNHTALENIFAPDWAVEVDMIRAWRYAFVPNLANVRRVYTRTIRNFRGRDDPKRLRHADRMEYDLECVMRTGRFDPTAYARVCNSSGRVPGF